MNAIIHSKLRTVELLGCSLDELKTYLESKFQPGMTWDNYSRNGWTIDHILPLSSFNLIDQNQLKKLVTIVTYNLYGQRIIALNLIL